LGTSPQPVQAPEAQPVPAQVVIRLTACIREMAALRGMTEAQYLAELAFADFAEHRCKKLCENAKYKAAKIERIEMNDADRHRTKLRPEQVQKLLFLAETLKLPHGLIAERMSISTSTVRRVLMKRERLVPNSPTGLRRHGQVWGGSGGGVRP
jgi:DNA-directed RNA polymerase specialized sigma24 family protein